MPRDPVSPARPFLCSPGCCPDWPQHPRAEEASCDRKGICRSGGPPSAPRGQPQVPDRYGPSPSRPQEARAPTLSVPFRLLIKLLTFCRAVLEAFRLNAQESTTLPSGSYTPLPRPPRLSVIPEELEEFQRSLLGTLNSPDISSPSEDEGTDAAASVQTPQPVALAPVEEEEEEGEMAACSPAAPCTQSAGHSVPRGKEGESEAALQSPLAGGGARTPAYEVTAALLTRGISVPLTLLPTKLAQDSSSDAELQRRRLLDRLGQFRSGRRRTRTRGAERVLRRETLLGDVLAAFQQPGLDPLQPLAFRFQGEDGVDSGGVSAEVYTLFYRQCGHPTAVLLSRLARSTDPASLPLSHRPCAVLTPGAGYFEGPEGEGDAAPSSPYVLPVRHGSRPLGDYRAFGRILARGCLDQCPAPPVLAPSLLRHLLGQPPCLEDLRAWSPALGRSLACVLAASPAGLEAMCLSRRCSLDPEVEGESVTAANREQYISDQVRAVLLDG